MKKNFDWPGGRGERRWEPSGAVPQRAPRQQDRLHHWPTVTLRTLQQQPYLLHSREEHPRSASSQGLAPVEESKLVHFISLSVAPVEESKRVPFFSEFHFSNGILPSSLGFHLLFFQWKPLGISLDTQSFILLNYADDNGSKLCNFTQIGLLLQTKHWGQKSKLLTQLPHDQVNQSSSSSSSSALLNSLWCATNTMVG